MRSADRGIVLIEALVALLLLGVAGGSMLMLVSQAADATRRTILLEATLADADRLLTALSLLADSELVAAVGTRRIGDHQLTIRALGGALYVLRISEGSAPLETVLYRPQGRQ